MRDQINRLIAPDFRGRFFKHNNSYYNGKGYCLICQKTGGYIMTYGGVKECIESVKTLASKIGVYDQDVFLQIFNESGKIVWNDTIELSEKAK